MLSTCFHDINDLRTEWHEIIHSSCLRSSYVATQKHIQVLNSSGPAIRPLSFTKTGSPHNDYDIILLSACARGENCAGYMNNGKRILWLMILKYIFHFIAIHPKLDFLVFLFREYIHNLMTLHYLSSLGSSHLITIIIYSAIPVRPWVVLSVHCSRLIPDQDSQILIVADNQNVFQYLDRTKHLFGMPL